jgi:hypothetical protein
LRVSSFAAGVPWAGPLRPAALPLALPFARALVAAAPPRPRGRAGERPWRARDSSLPALEGMAGKGIAGQRWPAGQGRPLDAGALAAPEGQAACRAAWRGRGSRDNRKARRGGLKRLPRP